MAILRRNANDFSAACDDFSFTTPARRRDNSRHRACHSRTMKLHHLLATAALTLGILFQARAESVKPAADQPVVQLAILLDTSNSMDGLIAQAKTQLWNIVNEFATPSGPH